MLSYTSNREDVLIQRAFAGIDRGTYLDIGAFTPVGHSNTYALYTRGWSGICVEPQPHFDADWARERPRDRLLHVLAGTADGEGTLYEVLPYGQLATTSEALARRHRETYRTQEVTQRTLPRRSASSLLDEFLPPGQPLHLASIDVEGAEAEVLRGFDFTRHRPWLLVVEATAPGRLESTHETWEPALLASGYAFAWFDGVNRFYAAREQAWLLDKLRVPPNVYDEFRDWFAEQRIRELEAAVLELHQTLETERARTAPRENA